jgi:hypothetical protein
MLLIALIFSGSSEEEDATATDSNKQPAVIVTDPSPVQEAPTTEAKKNLEKTNENNNQADAVDEPTPALKIPAKTRRLRRHKDPRKNSESVRQLFDAAIKPRKK